MSEEIEYQGTIKDKEDFDAEFAAKRFKLALKGMGTDEAMIIKMLTQHSSLQRQEIEEKYKAMYGRDLIEDLKDDIGGHFETAVLAMLTSPYDIMCQGLHSALSGVGTNEAILMEVLCCRTGDEIDSLAFHYERLHKKSLDEALRDDLSGDFRDLMRGLVTGCREEETGESDLERARTDAQELYDAGIGMNAGTDESEFINILNNRCFGQLKLTLNEYEKIADEKLEDSIEKEFSGNIKAGLLSLVKNVQDPLGFFAERLFNSMDGGGTDDEGLIRLLVLRSEIDLKDIKVRYKEMYGQTLYDAVKGDTSGDYQKLLLAIVKK